MTTSKTPTTSVDPVVLSPVAAAKILEVMAGQDDLNDDEKNLRLFVEGGGCSGPSFGIVFDKAADDDTHFECEGVSVIVDPLSLPYASGAHVDFIQTPEVTGFKVTAPAAAAMGGCSSGACGPGTGPDACGSAPPQQGGGCGSGGCC